MKIKTGVIAIIFLLSAPVMARSSTPQEEYIHAYLRTAEDEMERTGVPVSITLAQGLLESDAGRSTLARKGNNHFGIKCHSSWKGGRIYHDDDAKGECFRVYPDPRDSYRDHSNFLRYSDRYKFLFDYRKTDYKAWAYGLGKAGYATDPKYAQKLISIIETYRLGRYDVTVPVPDAPSTLERPVSLVSRIESTSYVESVEISLERPVYVMNGARFVHAQSGETYASIARTYDLFLSEILSFNDLDESTDLLPGTVVYVTRKRHRAAKGVDSYFFEENPVTLHDVAQRFGVTERSIRRRNRLPKDYEPVAGDEIKLR